MPLGTVKSLSCEFRYVSVVAIRKRAFEAPLSSYAYTGSIPILPTKITLLTPFMYSPCVFVVYTKNRNTSHKNKFRGQN